MRESRSSSYAAPVKQLLTYGVAEAVASDEWPDYRALGLGSEQIPDLIRLATDEALVVADEADDVEDLEIWGPVHALRALGQLRAEEAIGPLLTLLEVARENEWVIEELREVFGLIGPATFPALAADLASMSFNAQHHIDVTSYVDNIVEHWPDARAAGIELLVSTLERFDKNEADVNAFQVLGLVKMHAVETAPLIERAFAADCVDLSILGDWDDVQVEFGLLAAEELKQRRAKLSYDSPSSAPRLALTPDMIEMVSPPALTYAASQEKRQREVKHQKAKKQMTKQSRKKNRKR